MQTRMRLYDTRQHGGEWFIWGVWTARIVRVAGKGWFTLELKTDGTGYDMSSQLGANNNEDKTPYKDIPHQERKR